MSLVLRRLLLFLMTSAIAFAGMPAHAGGLPTAHHQIVQQPAEQHLRDEHRPGAAHHGGAANVDCSQVGHCSHVQLLSGAYVLAPEVLRRAIRYTHRDVLAASLMPEASTPPPRRA